MDRRIFLKGATAFGCSLAAHPLTTTLTMAAVPGEARLVVIILRGAMDGLDVVRPVGDSGFAALRPTLSEGTLGLGGQFGLHPALGPLMPLWAAGELGFAHAVSTPYRDKRSHFDGQDVLEAGTGLDVPVPAVRDGWLNRMIQAMPGVQAETAYAIGREALPVLEGAADVRSWSPDVALQLSEQNRLLLDRIYHDDPLFRDAGAEAITLAAETGAAASGGGPRADVEHLIDFAAGRLRGETRIAAFSQTGWDTHRAQGRALPKALDLLAASILRLKTQLGPVWGQTTVLAMTEFGRTVRENGTGGTDHGTGGVMLIAGGAVRGGRVMGRWPGIGETELYEGRDLMPTADVRSYAAWAMRGLYGLDRGLLEGSVFQGLDMGDDPGLLL
ncbi:MAG: twin-arginine translocation pathway signal [Cereibacter sphaeroides]|uniref:Twin-arginine translocation pathway signal n=1 Tax=Cereibacter sphaeroides TaxID=1063 RepID=A0A2W5S1A3_CERSP|nr:MAG: twin-arginine translocation pathway signal [Cereibacter sphaeroides]